MFGRRQKVEKHEKSMASYNSFAWHDAISIADYLASLYDLKTVRAAWEATNNEYLIELENNNFKLIGDFIQKSESQRPAFFKKITKDCADSSKAFFIVLAIVGVVRAARVMDLRDRYRSTLVPGRGNRITTASIYDFAIGVRNEHSYAWPSEVFLALDLDDGEDENDE